MCFKNGGIINNATTKKRLMVCGFSGNLPAEVTSLKIGCLHQAAKAELLTKVYFKRSRRARHLFTLLGFGYVKYFSIKNVFK